MDKEEFVKVWTEEIKGNKFVKVKFGFDSFILATDYSLLHDDVVVYYYATIIGILKYRDIKYINERD